MAKGESRKLHTDEEKLMIGKLVCDLYESQGNTIESCCKMADISESAFRLWCVQITEIGELYKKAKKVQEKVFWERAQPLIEKAFVRLIKGESKRETKREDGIGAGGPFSKDVVTESEILPNATVTIFGMKGIYPDRFVEKQELTGKDGAPLIPESTFLPASITVKVVKNDDEGA